MKKSTLTKCIIVALVFAVSTAIAGPKWDVGEDGWMKLTFLGQGHFSYNDKDPDDFDFFLRRARFILAGQITDGVKFFVETDNDNEGKDGQATGQMDIQDAFVDVRLHENHGMLAGKILLPFSFENRSSAASLLGIDYNAETIMLPNTHVWRDYGVEAHGKIVDNLAYRVGVFDGYMAEDGGALRLTGHLAVDLMDKAETGWFFTQDRLGKTKYLSVGVGFDTQGDATSVTVAGPTATNTVIEDYVGLVIDMQSGFALGEDMSVTVNGAFYDWDHARNNFSGNTAFLEAGLRCKKTLVTLKYSLQDPDGGVSTDDITAGVHYFLKGHNAKAGLEYRTGDSPDQALAGIQFLL